MDKPNGTIKKQKAVELLAHKIFELNENGGAWDESEVKDGYICLTDFGREIYRKVAQWFIEERNAAFRKGQGDMKARSVQVALSLGTSICTEDVAEGKRRAIGSRSAAVGRNIKKLTIKNWGEK